MIEFGDRLRLPTRIAGEVEVTERLFESGDLLAECRLFHPTTGIFVETRLTEAMVAAHGHTGSMLYWRERRRHALIRLGDILNQLAERN